MARDPAAKPPKAAKRPSRTTPRNIDPKTKHIEKAKFMETKEKYVDSKTKHNDTKAKYIDTKPPQGKQKTTKEKPLLLRRNSGSSNGSVRRNSAGSQSNGSTKRVHGFGPALGRDTSTPRARVEEDFFIQAVAEATSKSVKKKIPTLLVQEAESAAIVLPESPLTTPRTGEMIEVDSVSDDGDDDKYPAVCRRCYINFSTQTSPVCCHRFCDDCYEKCSVPTATKEKDKFACFACAKTESEAGSRAASFQRAVPILEYCSEELNKVYAFGSYAFVNPQRIAIASDGKTIVVVDSGCWKILLLNTDGELHQFSYLKNYHYQGGLCLTSDDTILLSLQNEKYTSASFYTTAGSFKFSAFLDHGAKATHLVVNSEDDIIALDIVSNTLDIINEQKRVHKQKTLTESEVFNPVSIATHPCTNYLYIYDSNNQNISIFDDRYHFISKFTLSNPEPIEESANDKTLKIIIDSDGILFRISRSWIKTYSLNGNFIYDAVRYEANPSFQAAGMCPLRPTIRDACLAGAGKLAVLMTGGAHTGEIRIYEYTVLNKHKTKAKPRKSMKMGSEACCVVS